MLTTVGAFCAVRTPSGRSKAAIRASNGVLGGVRAASDGDRPPNGVGASHRRPPGAFLRSAGGLRRVLPYLAFRIM